MNGMPDENLKNCMAKSCNSGLIYPLCTMPFSVKHLHSACSNYALIIENSIYITQLIHQKTLSFFFFFLAQEPYDTPFNVQTRQYVYWMWILSTFEETCLFPERIQFQVLLGNHNVENPWPRFINVNTNAHCHNLRNRLFTCNCTHMIFWRRKVLTPQLS